MRITLAATNSQRPWSDESLRRRDQVDERFAEGQLAAAAAEPREQRGEHVGCPVADRKHLAGFFDFGRDPFGGKEIERVVHAEGGERQNARIDPGLQRPR